MAAYKPKLQKTAFGTLSERFVYRGLHPSWEKRGYTYKYPHIAPGCYYSEKVSEPKGIGYARSLKSEELSRTLDRRADHKLKADAWIRSINGPGWHDVKVNGTQRFGTFAGANRFPVSQALATPGPGIYGKDHVPHKRLEERSRAKGFSFSGTPSFEYDNCMPRSTISHSPYHLPPNIYRVKSSTDEVLRKVVSRRGPYDLFTGARDESSVYGHRARLGGRCEGSYFEPSTTIERLNNVCNRHKGKFLQCGRETHPTTRFVLTDPALSKPDPDKPAPNQYRPRTPSKPESRSCFPFLSSVLHARPLKKIELKPPPGRYEHQTRKRIRGNGMKSAFLSTVRRGIPLPEKMSWF